MARWRLTMERWRLTMARWRLTTEPRRLTINIENLDFLNLVGSLNTIMHFYNKKLCHKLKNVIYGIKGVRIDDYRY